MFHKITKHCAKDASNYVQLYMYNVHLHRPPLGIPHSFQLDFLNDEMTLSFLYRTFCHAQSSVPRMQCETREPGSRDKNLDAVPLNGVRVERNANFTMIASGAYLTQIQYLIVVDLVRYLTHFVKILSLPATSLAKKTSLPAGRKVISCFLHLSSTMSCNAVVEYNIIVSGTPPPVQ